MRTQRKPTFWVGLIAAIALAGLAPGAQAYLVTASSGSLAASANFTSAGGNLTVVLTNTSAFDVTNPAQILTAVFFSIAGVPPAVLTPVSATLSGGSTVYFGPINGGDMGGEWAYAVGIPAPGGANSGTSSAGFGLFGAGNFPGGTNLQGPVAVNGVQYGITSAGDNTAVGNAAVTGGNALIGNEVTFVLSGLPGGFVADAAHISNVSFQYGTSLDETNIPGTPEPTTLLALGAGLAGLGALRLRRKQKP